MRAAIHHGDRMIAYQVREDGAHGPIDVDDDLSSLHEAIGGYIDIVTRRIGSDGREYAIICDDEGILRDREVTAVRGCFQALVGNLLIVRKGTRGDLKSLTNKDIDYISKSMKDIWTCADHAVVRSVLELI